MLTGCRNTLKAERCCPEFTKTNKHEEVWNENICWRKICRPSEFTLSNGNVTETFRSEELGAFVLLIGPFVTWLYLNRQEHSQLWLVSVIACVWNIYLSICSCCIRGHRSSMLLCCITTEGCKAAFPTMQQCEWPIIALQRERCAGKRSFSSARRLCKDGVLRPVIFQSCCFHLQRHTS